MADFPPNWIEALSARAVWWRTARVGLPIGLLQDCANQGEAWLHGKITAAVVARSVLIPLVTLTVSLLSATSTCRLLPPEN